MCSVNVKALPSPSTLSTFISYNYFEMEKAGYASAIGIFMFVFIYIVSTVLTNFFKKREVQY